MHDAPAFPKPQRDWQSEEGQLFQRLRRDMLMVKDQRYPVSKLSRIEKKIQALRENRKGETSTFSTARSGSKKSCELFCDMIL